MHITHGSALYTAKIQSVEWGATEDLMGEENCTEGVVQTGDD